MPQNKVKQADNIKEVRFSDGHDGSVYITITFKDGSTLDLNPDLDYDNEVLAYQAK